MDERENDAHKEKLQDTLRPPDQVAEERQKARHETDEHERLQSVEKGMGGAIRRGLSRCPWPLI